MKGKRRGRLEGLVRLPFDQSPQFLIADLEDWVMYAAQPFVPQIDEDGQHKILSRRSVDVIQPFTGMNELLGCVFS